MDSCNLLSWDAAWVKFSLVASREEIRPVKQGKEFLRKALTCHSFFTGLRAWICSARLSTAGLFTCILEIQLRSRSKKNNNLKLEDFIKYIHLFFTQSSKGKTYQYQNFYLLFNFLILFLFIYLFFIILAASHSMWDLGSRTRDRNHIPCIGSIVLIIGPPGKPKTFFKSYISFLLNYK